MKNLVLALAIAVTLSLTVRSTWAATPSYVLTDLGPGEANAINALGQVAGTSSATGSDQAFLYAGGTFTYLGSLGGGLSRGNAVNLGGSVAGGSTNTTPV